MRRDREKEFAVESGWVENGIWTWAGWGGAPGTERYEFHDPLDAVLKPWEGFWLWAEEEGLELVIPPLSELIEGAPAPERKPPLWKVTLAVDGSRVELGVAVLR